MTGQATSAEPEETDTSEQDTGAEESDITSEQQGLADKTATSGQQRVSCSIFDPAALIGQNARSGHILVRRAHVIGRTPTE